MSIMNEKKSLIASGHPRVSEAAAEILRSGGNAFDAVVAAGFASAIAEPALTSLGGGGFLLARAASGQARVFDFFVDTPGHGRRGAELEPHFVPVTVQFPNCEQVFNVGMASVAVPGCLRGYLQIHARLGRLPLHEILVPAICLARDGLELNARQAYFLSMLRPIMTLMPAARKVFEANGRYIAAGDRFTEPALADFLETLPDDGDREFYEGELARRIVDDMETGAGLLSLADLAAYRVIEREPLAQDYRGYRLLTNSPPSFGGSLIALSLRMLASADLYGVRFGSARHLDLLVTVQQEVDRLRAAGYLNGVLAADEEALSQQRIRTASGGTTHISILDREGNAASMTTSNGEGSGYIVPGIGVMLNNMMGEDDLHPDGFHASPAGIRVASMMSPSILLRDDNVAMVCGSGGSKRIRTAILQVISNIVDFGMSLEEAVTAVRLHWDGDCVQIEPGFDDSELALLRQKWDSNVWSVKDIYFGGVHAVTPQGEAVGDARRGGHAMRLDC